MEGHVTGEETAVGEKTMGAGREDGGSLSAGGCDVLRRGLGLKALGLRVGMSVDGIEGRSVRGTGGA